MCSCDGDESTSLVKALLVVQSLRSGTMHCFNFMQRVLHELYLHHSSCIFICLYARTLILLLSTTGCTPLFQSTTKVFSRCYQSEQRKAGFGHFNAHIRHCLTLPALDPAKCICVRTCSNSPLVDKVK